MSADDDPLIELIHAAGDVPPPPDRDRALARAMGAISGIPSRRRFRRGVITLFAAAMLAAPAGVFAARTFHSSPATIGQIRIERPDPGTSIARESSDSADKSASHQIESGDDRSGPDGDDTVSSGESGGSDDQTEATVEDSSGETSDDGAGETEALTGGDDGETVNPSPTSTTVEEPDGSSSLDTDD